jgi:hypothetical protein
VLHVAVLLTITFGLAALAMVTSVAVVLYPEVYGLPAARAWVARRRAWIDPNEAARAAGSWG